MTALREMAAVVDRLGRLVSGSDGIGPLLAQLCSSVGAATGAAVAVLRDSDGTGLEMPAASGDFVNGHAGILLAAARSLASAAIDAGEERGATVRPAAGGDAEQAEWLLLALPLPLDHRVGGRERAAVVLARTGPAWFDDERALARQVADDLGTLVGSAMLAEQLRADLAAQSAMRRLLAEGATTGTTLEAAQIVAGVVRDVLATECSIVFTYPEGDGGRLNVAVEGLAPDEERAVWRALRRGFTSSAGWQRASQSDDPLFVDEVDAVARPGGLVESSGMRSYVSVPLRSGSGRVGHVLTGDLKGPRRWTPSERLLVAQLATEASLVLDGARLRQTERAQRNLLAHQASHDPLTGLANRRAFTDELAAAIATAEVDHRRLAVLMLDLDGFKDVNDSLGHHVGDALLVEVSRAIRRAPCLPYRCARLGGDEFALLLLDTDEAAAQRAARQLSTAISRICSVDGHRLSVRASVGMALYPEQGADGAQLLRSADAAMYTAKRGSRPPLEPSRPAPTGSPGLLGELRQALDRGELVVHYQPQVSLSDGAMTSAEALVRWAHPRELLLPGQFLPAASRGGLLPRLGRLVLESALTQQGDWRRAGLELGIAVNITGPDLYEAGFVEHVAACLERFDLPASALTFELSEQALLASRHAAAEILAALRSLGVRVSLDNFGTVGSSLGHLDSLPIDELKIDRSLLRNTLSDDDGGLLAAIVSLCHDLSVTVVAEGVETAAVADRLAELGCDLAQGFLYGPPAPADDLARALA